MLHIAFFRLFLFCLDYTMINQVFLSPVWQEGWIRLVVANIAMYLGTLQWKGVKIPHVATSSHPYIIIMHIYVVLTWL